VPDDMRRKVHMWHVTVPALSLAVTQGWVLLMLRNLAQAPRMTCCHGAVHDVEQLHLLHTVLLLTGTQRAGVHGCWLPSCKLHLPTPCAHVADTTRVLATQVSCSSNTAAHRDVLSVLLQGAAAATHLYSSCNDCVLAPLLATAAAGVPGRCGVKHMSYTPQHKTALK
jgi:hypothetical protein